MTPPVFFAIALPRPMTVDELSAMCDLGVYYRGQGVFAAFGESERAAREWWHQRDVETEGCSAPKEDRLVGGAWMRSVE